MKNKVRPTYAATATQRTVESDARRFPALLRTMEPDVDPSREIEVDEIAAEFFSQASVHAASYDADDFRPMSRGTRAAMHATFAMLSISGVGLAAFLVYSRLIMPVPEELGVGGDLEVPALTAAAAATPEYTPPRPREWRAMLFDPSAPQPQPATDAAQAAEGEPTGAEGAPQPPAAPAAPAATEPAPALEHASQ